MGPKLVLKVYDEDSQLVEKLLDNIKEEFSFSAFEVLKSTDCLTHSLEQKEPIDFLSTVHNSIESEGRKLYKSLQTIGDRLLIFLFNDKLFHLYCREERALAGDIVKHYSSFPYRVYSPTRVSLGLVYKKEYKWIYSPFVALCAPTTMLPKENTEAVIKHELNHTFHSTTDEWMKLRYKSPDFGKYEDTHKNPFYHFSCADETGCVGIDQYFMVHNWGKLGKKCKSSIAYYQERIGNKPLTKKLVKSVFGNPTLLDFT
jgi:predicted DNA-binding WGR domain protein